MKGKIFFLIFISLFMSVSLWAIENVPFNIKGIFFLQNGWSGISGTSTFGGYPGRIDYGTGGGQIFPDGSLSGSFWIGNVGWVTFTHGMVGSEARINCPTTIWNDATQPCPVSGAAWSQNAGWIVFGSGDIGTGSGVYFDPNTGNLAGWGWNKSVGWIPIWTGLTGSTIPDASTPTDPLNGVPVNFVSKIAIIGNIAGSRVFSVANNSVVNQDVGYSYTTVNHANILNMIHRNIALISRNINDTDLTNLSSSHDFYIKNGINFPGSEDFVITSNMLLSYLTAGKRSIIVIGGDIIIDEIDVNSLSWNNRPIGLIALKDENGKGGNIVITDKTKRIYAYMYAEGTVYSGEKYDSLSPIVPYTASGVWSIPKGQLYIRGLVASKNTIGGSQQKPTPICPVLTSICNDATSYYYDWDYFRTYDNTDPSQSSLPAERLTTIKLQNATMIIEYDSQILVDPPPGFREQ